MTLYVLVEGRADELFLKAWLRRARPGLDLRVIPHGGKGALPEDPAAPVPFGRRGLLDQLPVKLREFGRSLDPAQERVLVLVDADADDCVALKSSLLGLLATCDPAPKVKFRIACEESEAFYLGERQAIEAGYGPLSPARAALFDTYAQDAVCGTWERFRDVIGASSENKSAWASTMGNKISTDPNANRSPSFRQLCRAIDQLLEED